MALGVGGNGFGGAYVAAGITSEIARTEETRVVSVARGARRRGRSLKAIVELQTVIVELKVSVWLSPANLLFIN